MSTKTRAPAGRAGCMPSVKWTTRFAYAAGATGILANLLLVGYFAMQATHPEDGTYLGPANDLVGALATAFMMSVAVGLPAMAILTVAGPLLVLGVLAFNIQAAIAVAV